MFSKIIFFLLCFYSPLALGQLTQVSGTIKDPSGLAYANGTITPTLVISATPRFSFNSLPYTPPTGPVGLDSKGSFVMSLGDVNQLTPSGGTWSFHVCSAIGTVQPGSPITQGPVCFDVTGVIITGTAVSLTATLSAAAPPLTTSSGSVTVFPINCPPSAVCMTTPSASNVGLGFANLAGFQTAAVFGSGGTPIGQILALQVNGTPVGSFPGTPAANFNATTPAVPANGRAIQWQDAVGNPATISAALVGDGSTNCLNGQGNYVACSGSGFPGSGTNPFVATSTLELPTGTVLSPSLAAGSSSNAGINFTSTGNGIQLDSGLAAQLFVSSNFITVTPPLCDAATGTGCLTFTSGRISVTGSGAPAFQTQPGTSALPGLSIGSAVDGFDAFGTHQIGLVSNGFSIANFNASDGIDLNPAVTINWAGASALTGPGLTLRQFSNSNAGAGILTVGSATSAGNAESGLIRWNTCKLSADTVLSVNTATAICFWSLPAIAATWAWTCDIPWAITAGTGTNTISIGVNSQQTPTGTTNATGVIYTAASSFVTAPAVPISTSGPINVITSGTITPSANAWTSHTSGTLLAPATLGNFVITMTAAGTTATAAAKAGATCTFY